MTADEIKARIVAVLPRDLLIDLADMAAARALEAHELVGKTDLAGRSARGLEGQARFRLMEKGFEDTCSLHGAMRLVGDVIAGTDLRCFQPFMRFGDDQPGILLGLASMPVPAELPAKNLSRSSGTTLNYHLTPRLDLAGDGGTAKIGDIFVLFLFARDATRAGQLQEIAIGVIDAEYEIFLMYEPVEDMMAAYTSPPAGTGPGADDEPLVKLKKTAKEFRSPERPESDDATDNSAG